MLYSLNQGFLVAERTAQALNVPLIAVNHLEAHTLVARMEHKIPFPFLSLVISGGHTFLALSHDVGRHELLGSTMDDAIGEAFDKVGRALVSDDHAYSHFGSALEALAATAGQSDNVGLRLPVPLRKGGRLGYDFSFSGLKTAALLAAESKQYSSAIVASAFQASIVEHVGDVVRRGLMQFAANGNQLSLERNGSPREWDNIKTKRSMDCDSHGISALVVSGGAASNLFLRRELKSLTDKAKVALVVPSRRLCVDNGVMIGWTAGERLAKGLAKHPTCLRAKWPLDEA